MEERVKLLLLSTYKMQYSSRELKIQKPIFKVKTNIVDCMGQLSCELHVVFVQVDTKPAGTGNISTTSVADARMSATTNGQQYQFLETAFKLVLCEVSFIVICNITSLGTRVTTFGVDLIKIKFSKITPFLYCLEIGSIEDINVLNFIYNRIEGNNARIQDQNKEEKLLQPNSNS